MPVHYHRLLILDLHFLAYNYTFNRLSIIVVLYDRFGFRLCAASGSGGALDLYYSHNGAAPRSRMHDISSQCVVFGHYYSAPQMTCLMFKA